jgi:hypothetical protein
MSVHARNYRALIKRGAHGVLAEDAEVEKRARPSTLPGPVGTRLLEAVRIGAHVAYDFSHEALDLLAPFRIRAKMGRRCRIV